MPGTVDRCVITDPRRAVEDYGSVESIGVEFARHVIKHRPQSGLAAIHVSDDFDEPLLLHAEWIEE